MTEPARRKRQPQGALELVTHEFPPVYDSASRVLILGSIPSPKSREQQFYYGHPRNRFWAVLAAVYGEAVPADVPAKRAFLLRHQLALWDVLAQCRIHGADDSSIADPVPNDLLLILQAADIRAIFTTGKKAHALYQMYCLPKTGRQDICLPSTSPANCAVNFDALQKAYQAVREACGN